MYNILFQVGVSLTMLYIMCENIPYYLVLFAIIANASEKSCMYCMCVFAMLVNHKQC